MELGLCIWRKNNALSLRKKQKEKENQKRWQEKEKNERPSWLLGEEQLGVEKQPPRSVIYLLTKSYMRG